MRLPLLTDSYESYAKSNTSRRLVNFYLEQDPKGKSQLVAMPTPGLDLIYTLPTLPVRGVYFMPQTAQSVVRRFAISGNVLYELFASSYTALATLQSTIGYAKFTHGVGQLCFVTNGKLGVFNLTTGVVSSPVTPLTDLIDLEFIDNIFVIANRNSFALSEVNEATIWDALDFATPESKPDSIRGMRAISGQMKFLGDRTVEVWRMTGDLFPLQRAGNTFAERGCIATYSIVKLDNTMFWLGEDDEGGYVVWKAEGYSPARISHHGLENSLRNMAKKGTLEDVICYGMVHNGHSFYVMNFPSADATYMYDVATGIWSEWLSWDNGAYHRHRVHVHCYGGGEHWGGDWQNGNIYRFNQDTYTDAGATIRRLIRSQVLNAENRRQFFSNLQIDIEPGQGLPTGQGSLPQIMVRFSDDGGFTWNQEIDVYAGKIGEYLTRAKIPRCGSAYSRVIEISMSDPIKWVVEGATVDMTA